METPVVNVADVLVGEGKAYVDFVVWLSEASALPVSVGYSANSGSAFSSSDFSSTRCSRQKEHPARYSLLRVTTEGNRGTWRYHWAMVP
jgi:hypothetical protein